MDDLKIEEILIIGIRIGTIATIKRLGLGSELVSLKDAYSTYSRKTVDGWRRKGWITFYATGEMKTSKNYCKRSELELASARMDMNNVLKVNRIHKEIMR